MSLYPGMNQWGQYGQDPNAGRVGAGFGGGQGMQGMFPYAQSNPRLQQNIIQRMQPGGYSMGGFGGAPGGQWGMPGSSYQSGGDRRQQEDARFNALRAEQMKRVQDPRNSGNRDFSNMARKYDDQVLSNPRGVWQGNRTYDNDMRSNRAVDPSMYQTPEWNAWAGMQQEFKRNAGSPQGSSNWNPWVSQPATPQQVPADEGVSRPSHPPNGPGVPGSAPSTPVTGIEARSTRPPSPAPITPDQYGGNPPATGGLPNAADVGKVMEGQGNITDLIRQTGNATGTPSRPNPGTPSTPGVVAPPGAPTPAGIRGQIPDALNNNNPNGPNITDLVGQVGRYQPGMGLGIERPWQIPGAPQQPNFGMGNYGVGGAYGGFGGFGNYPGMGGGMGSMFGNMYGGGGGGNPFPYGQNPYAMYGGMQQYRY